MKKIAIIAGDGIGPEVTECSRLLLEKIAKQYSWQFSFEEVLMGHVAIEATGNPLPEETLAACRRSDAILFGAVGHPYYDDNPQLKVRPEQGLLKLRKELGLYANVRPIQVFPELSAASPLKTEIIAGADIVFFRELTGGIYFGQPRERQNNGNTALDTMIYHRYEVERIARKAFEAAMQRQKRLCSVDKANVLESSRLWRETVNQIAEEYPEVSLSHMFVDNAAMQLIKNPKQFDVVLTGNMFGDILTDEASQITGSLGMLPSASLGDSVGLYEPIHGSAPDIAGKKIANPMASMLSAALMLDLTYGEIKAGNQIRRAIQKTLQGGYRTADIADKETPKEKILDTYQITTEILQRLENE
jgi:3-isopropylmalate dehydrogenase